MLRTGSELRLGSALGLGLLKTITGACVRSSSAVSTETPTPTATITTREILRQQLENDDFLG